MNDVFNQFCPPDSTGLYGWVCTSWLRVFTASQVDLGRSVPSAGVQVVVLRGWCGGGPVPAGLFVGVLLGSEWMGCEWSVPLCSWLAAATRVLSGSIRGVCRMNMRYSFVSWLLPNRWLFVANGTKVKYECSRVINSGLNLASPPQISKNAARGASAPRHQSASRAPKPGPPQLATCVHRTKSKCNTESYQNHWNFRQ